MCVVFFFPCMTMQDKAQPETQATSFGNVLFNAKLAIDDPEAISLVKQPGSDGFKVDSTPLFQVCFLYLGNKSTEPRKETLAKEVFLSVSHVEVNRKIYCDFSTVKQDYKCLQISR